MLLFIILALHFIGTNSSPITNRIINGTDASPAPWVVRIIIGFENGTDGAKISSNCGGSLISPQWVLTAKHCVLDEDGNLNHKILAVSIGNNYFLNGSLYSVIDVYVPNNDGYADDIALLKLIHPIYSITPIKLQLNDNLDYEDQNASIYGWGLNALGSPEKYLQVANVVLESRSECQDEKMICFNPQLTKTNSCSGDSGGPMTIIDQNNQIVQIGISHAVERVYNVSCQGNRSWYVSTSYYGTWIQNIVNFY